jgi:8-oxo-dGTP pyrophosphatase MutT (NUDIX family)
MRELEIVLGLIQQGDNFIFQRRLNERRVGAAGLIGCFGGKIEPGETKAEAVAREIDEETTLVTLPEDWEQLTDVEVMSDRDNEPVRVYGTAFVYTLLPGQKIQAKEGELVVIPKGQCANPELPLTPATKELLRKLARQHQWPQA